MVLFEAGRPETVTSLIEIAKLVRRQPSETILVELSFGSRTLAEIAAANLQLRIPFL